MTPDRSLQILRAASVVTLLALALMTWSLFDPRPVPVMVAMSLGQALGTLALLAYLVVVAFDLRRALGQPQAPPAPPPGDHLLDFKLSSILWKSSRAAWTVALGPVILKK